MGAHPMTALIGAVALLTGPVTMSVRTAISRNNILLIFPLVLLYLTYGIARAICLTGLTLPRPAKPVVPDSLAG